MKRPLAISGPMGVGKSTVARALAERTGAPLLDVDRAIEEQAAESISAIFAREGEARFRSRETEVIARALSLDPPPVIALGGGAVTDVRTRRLLLHRAIVVTLRASTSTLVARIGEAGVAARPLLASEASPEARLDQLLQERAVAYAEAHLQLDTEGKTPDELAAAIAAAWARDPVAVALGERTYRVEIGRGVVTELPNVLCELRARSVVLVTDDRVWPAVRARIEPVFEGARVIARVVLPSGEAHKTLESIARIWDAAIDGGADRSTVIVAVGGGVVGDLAGFAASTLLRGVRVVQVPTTLLAMVDASVGGKTAIDRPQGKNLVGAFHQPSAVLADVALLDTLPARELGSGLAEVVKTALIGDADLFDLLEKQASQLTSGDLELLTRVVRASIAHKARVVSEDERDASGARASLNFGHTIGHALESHGGYATLTHGEAVGLGMLAALRVGLARGHGDRSLIDRVTRLLATIGLPHVLDARDVEAALPFVTRDKKREGDRVVFVLVPQIGRSTLEPLSLEELRAILVPKAQTNA